MMNSDSIENAKLLSHTFESFFPFPSYLCLYLPTLPDYRKQELYVWFIPVSIKVPSIEQILNVWKVCTILLE